MLVLSSLLYLLLPRRESMPEMQMFQSIPPVVLEEESQLSRVGQPWATPRDPEASVERVVRGGRENSLRAEDFQDSPLTPRSAGQLQEILLEEFGEMLQSRIGVQRRFLLRHHPRPV